MKNVRILTVIVCVMAAVNFTSADTDTFGSGENQFTIDFVPISGSTNPTSGIPAGPGFTFTGVNNDYRMGKYEVSNAQWTKFKAAYGAVTGNPSYAYGQTPQFTGESVPTNRTSWYEAAQFVNYLNTSTGNQAAYKFTGTQGTTNYTFTTWASTDTGYNASNPYRNSNAFYFLPTENEWVKAAYWNGVSIQTYATKAGETPFQGNGTNGGWNYYDYNNGFATNPRGPWAVTSGSQELNGTYDMMGNVWEWMESPYYSGYLSGSRRGLRGGSYIQVVGSLGSSGRGQDYPSLVYYSLDYVGFRVASVPEPATICLLGLGAVMLRRRR
jgi:formylglycine-generating enzyme required for sulfatase activity